MSLVIRGGTVVDGMGGTPAPGDVAIDGDRITAVGTVDDGGRREIDAHGAHVTPGFVDIHTHLDAQLAWDPDATSSCWHGVTSVVLGNCGVTFAPVRPGQERWLAELMESVEGIPADSILSGLRFDWETYGEYLRDRRAPQRRQRRRDDRALRGAPYAMGERSLDEAPAGRRISPSTCAVVDEAIGRRARVLDVAHAAHTVPTGARPGHVGRRA
jgi:hypothetical protein